MRSWRAVAALAVAAGIFTLAHGAEPRLVGPHGGDIFAVAFSPDGSLLASGASRTVKVWVVGTGQELWVLAGHDGPVRTVAWSPDGTVLASGSEDGTVRLWDPATGEEIRMLDLTPAPRTVEVFDFATWQVVTVEVFPKASVHSVAWSPDGMTLATCSCEIHGECEVVLWDPTTGERRRTIPGPRRIGWRPDGSIYATVGDDGVALWDASSGEAVRTLDGRGFALWSPDGAHLLTSAADGWTLWDAETGERVRTLSWRGSGTPVLSPDGRFLAYAYAGSMVLAPRPGGMTVHHLATGVVVVRETVPFPGSGCVAFSPQGGLLAYGTCGEWEPIGRGASRCVQGMVALLDTTDLASAVDGLTAALWGQRGTVNWVGFAPDTGQVVSGSSKATLVTWELASGDVLWSVDTGHGQEIACAALSPDGRFVATTGVFWDKTVRVWDLATGARVTSIQAPWDVKSVAWNPAGSGIAYGSIDRTIRIAEVGAWNEVTVLPRQDGVPWDLSFHPAGELLAAGLADGTVTVWEVGTRSLIGTLRGHTAGVGWVAFSPDGSLLASGSKNEVRLWDTETWEEVGTLAPGITGPLAFDPEGRLLALVTSEGRAELWSVVTREPVGRAGLGDVGSVAFSPDGLLVATGRADGSVLVWDVARLVDGDAGGREPR